MNKLTTEQKAERYDEVLERVVNIRTGKCETTFIFTEGLFNYLFPELEECNEEVREAMIDFFKHEREEGVVVSHYGVNIERMIAWLEKQKTSEEAIQYLKENHSPSEVSDFQAAMNIAVAKAYDKGVKDGLENRGQTFTKKEVDDAYLAGVRDAKKELEKQSEQKQDPCKDCKYPMLNCHNFPCLKKQEYQDKTALEAIKEEKVDNADKVEPKDYNSIDPHFGKPTDKIEPKFHEKDWSIDDYLWQITAKEQLDVLYTKIKEAGYEWDDEKKEFKKIKNPAWSEKDEAVVKDICDKLSWLRVIYTGNQNIACQKDIYWLKSLKGRVGCEANFTTMWKPSEKQIMCLQDALSDYHRRGYKAETLETLLKQLKQL